MKDLQQQLLQDGDERPFSDFLTQLVNILEPDVDDNTKIKNDQSWI